MKITNTLLTILALLMFSNITSAQTDKRAIQLAESRVQEIDEMITSVNPNAELTAEQKVQIKEMHIKRTNKIVAVKNNNALTDSEKESKIVALRKEFGKMLSKEVFTQEQRQAKKKAKSMSSKGDN